MARFDALDAEDRVRSVFRPRNILFALVGAIGISAAFGGYYVVDQTERAGVRRFGVLVSEKAIQPGLHFKIPFIDTVDEVTTSLTSHKIQPFTVNTVDNQQVTFDISINYEIADEGVFHVLYEVGRRGEGAVKDSITQIARDRVARVVASKNTNSLSADREKIQAEIQASITHDLQALLKVTVKSLQIGPFDYSDTFKKSIEEAVQAKNIALREEYNLKVFQNQAAQKVAVAEGQAQERIAQARGQKESAILAAQGQAEAVAINAKALVTQAEADKKAAELRGAGDASALAAIVSASGGADKYVEKLKAEAAQKWNGSVPTTVFGGQGASTVAPIIPFNLPSAK